MKENSLVFATSLLPFSATTLAAHRNPVTCILLGLDRPLTVYAGDHHVEGDIVVIRPGVEHWVEIGGRAKVLYFDALSFPLDAAVAGQLPEVPRKTSHGRFRRRLRSATGTSLAADNYPSPMSARDCGNRRRRSRRSNGQDVASRTWAAVGIGTHESTSAIQGNDRTDLPELQKLDRSEGSRAPNCIRGNGKDCCDGRWLRR